jgi:hypothetical protein
MDSTLHVHVCIWRPGMASGCWPTRARLTFSGQKRHWLWRQEVREDYRSQWVRSPKVFVEFPGEKMILYDFSPVEFFLQECWILLFPLRKIIK